MLTISSGIGSAFKDPPTKVRVLTDMYVKGEIVKAGDVATMSLSDAQALRNSVPPSVEILA